MRYIYKKSCPINADNWDDFLIKNNPDYLHITEQQQVIGSLCHGFTLWNFQWDNDIYAMNNIIRLDYQCFMDTKCFHLSTNSV